MIPPATPPAIPLMCDVGDGIASEPGIFATGEEEVNIPVVAEDVVRGVDFGLWDDVEAVDTPKHETSAPFSTEKGNEVIICADSAIVGSYATLFRVIYP